MLELEKILPGSQQLFRSKRPTSARFYIEGRHRNIADMLSNVKLKILTTAKYEDPHNHLS